jgi:hypothetical protein
MLQKRNVLFCLIGISLCFQLSAQDTAQGQEYIITRSDQKITGDIEEIGEHEHIEEGFIDGEGIDVDSVSYSLDTINWIQTDNGYYAVYHDTSFGTPYNRVFERKTKGKIDVFERAKINVVPMAAAGMAGGMTLQPSLDIEELISKPPDCKLCPFDYEHIRQAVNDNPDALAVVKSYKRSKDIGAGFLVGGLVSGIIGVGAFLQGVRKPSQQNIYYPIAATGVGLGFVGGGVFIALSWSRIGKLNEAVHVYNQSE